MHSSSSFSTLKAPTTTHDQNLEYIYFCDNYDLSFIHDVNGTTSGMNALFVVVEVLDVCGMMSVEGPVSIPLDLRVLARRKPAENLILG